MSTAPIRWDARHAMAVRRYQAACEWVEDSTRYLDVACRQYARAAAADDDPARMSPQTRAARLRAWIERGLAHQRVRCAQAEYQLALAEKAATERS